MFKRASQVEAYTEPTYFAVFEQTFMLLESLNQKLDQRNWFTLPHLT